MNQDDESAALHHQSELEWRRRIKELDDEMQELNKMVMRDGITLKQIQEWMRGNL